MSAAQQSLICRLDSYCDIAPRTTCRAEAIGSFTLFVNEGGGWNYYARPSGGAATFATRDVERVRARQRKLGIPEAFEWIDEAAPSLEAVAWDSGLAVGRHPLMVLGPGWRRIDPPRGFAVRLVGPDDDLAVIGAVARLAFSSPGTAVGPAGIEALAASVGDGVPDPATFERSRLDRGLTVTVVAETEGIPVAVGSHQPVGDVTEIVGIGTLPAFRRRGLGAAVASFLVDHVQSLGIATVFLSAGDDGVARVYGRVGFERVGTACLAEPVGS